MSKVVASKEMLISRASSSQTFASTPVSHDDAGQRRPPMAEPEAVDSQNSMDKNLRFPDYILSKMAAAGEAADAGVADRHGAARPCGEAFRVWGHENMLLLITIVGVFSGLVLGFGLRSLALGSDPVMLISYPGELFMRLLKLLILPLIIASLISGCARLNATMNGRIAARTIVYFACTSLINAALGTTLVLLIHPGEPLGQSQEPKDSKTHEPRILDGLLDLGRNIFPDNLFKAAFQQAHTVYVEKRIKTNGNDSMTLATAAANHVAMQLVRSVEYREGTNTLGIIVFCFVFGTVLGTLGSKAKVVVEFFTIVDEVVMRMVTGVMWLTPIGVASVIAGKILSVAELSIVAQQLGWFIFTVVLGVFIYQIFISQFIYFIIIRRNPYKFYMGLVQATLTAFATASTAAALPVTFRCMDGKLRVDPRVSRFVLPIGCTINMDGTALFVAVATIFIAQMNDMQLGIGEIITVWLASTAASFSSASVPSAALVLIFMVLATIQAPTHEVSLLFAVDWFVDRIRTTNNMLGDCYAAAVVEHLSRDQLASEQNSSYPFIMNDSALNNKDDYSNNKGLHSSIERNPDNPEELDTILVEGSLSAEPLRP